jgi:hypothetical protein
MQPQKNPPFTTLSTSSRWFRSWLHPLNLGWEIERLALLGVLVLAFIHGILYVFLVPPWQHYDEPNHFEYVWLLANRPGWPHPGDYDQTMRRDVARSMLEHGFFQNLDFLPDLDSDPENPIWIGQYQQLGEPPLYHLIASIPLRLLPFTDVTTQLYSIRLVSLVLFMFTIFVAWGLTSELLPSGHPLRILVPFSMAMLPGFTDLMTSINSDVGAVAIFSLFLWGSVRLIRRKFSLANLVWTASTAALTYWTKNTVYLAIPMFGVALLLSVFRRGVWRKLAWGLLLIGAILGSVIIFSWGDAILWYRTTLQDTPTRVVSSLSPLGDHAFELQIKKGDSPTYTQLRQIIPPDTVRELAGKIVTVGAWVWADQPLEIIPPGLFDPSGNLSKGSKVTVGVEPAFYAVRATFPRLTDRAWVSMAPLLKKADTSTRLYFDGLVLVEGEPPLEVAPEYDDGTLDSGIWGGYHFSNLLRNGSAEISGPRVRSWADDLATKFIPDRGRLSQIIYSLVDLKAAGWYYRVTALNLVRTFWAKFGWGNVPLLGHKPYRVVGVVTLLGVLGALSVIWRKRKAMPWDTLVFLGLVMLGIWGITWIRGSVYLFRWIFIPSARYAFPAIIPTMLVLNLGWLGIIRWIMGWLRSPDWMPYAVYGGLWLVFDMYAVISLLAFY